MLLTMRGICKSFAGVQVLKDVDFDLQAGEVHVLAGENGAGKTTLIKILAGIHSDYRGNIELNGKPLKLKSAADAARKGISAIHQDMSLVSSMSVEDNLFLGRERAKARVWVDRDTQRKAALSLLRELGILAAPAQLVSECSMSIRQKIEIGKALVNEAQIIIMDEPTSSLNNQEVARLFEIIIDLKKRGHGIIFISHRMDEIYRIGDRITVLRDGTRVGTEKAEDLTQKRLVRWMVGREIDQQFPARSGGFQAERLRVRDFRLPCPTRAQKHLVDNVSFSVRSGEILGIAGLQGSGKSELLNGIFGAYGTRAEGTIEVDGESFSIRSPRHSIQQGIGLLTNDRKNSGLVNEMSVARNISLASLREFSRYGWMLTQKENETARNRVKDLSIKIRSLQQNIQTLSGGNQQKAVLAKWICTQPKILLLDEPTTGVDVGAKHEIYTLMNTWTSRGIAILLITSELPELLAMSDRILVMHRGRISAEFSGQEATQENITHAALGASEAA
jgi:ABC-type sugar transport system ATPase subunit